MGLPEYLEVLRRRWRLVAACVLVGVLAGLAATLVGAERTASTTLIISTGGASAVDLTPQRLASYAELATSPRVAGAVAADLGDDDVAGVRADLDATADPASLLLVITARDPVPELARAKATSTARQLVALVEEVSPSAPALAVAQPAVLEPSSRAVAALGGASLGAALGLAGGVALALVRDAGDRRLRGVPALTGALAGAWATEVAASDRQLRAGAATSASGPAAEGFRRLRAAVVAQGSEPLSGRTLLVAGCRTGEGSAAVAHGLAVALARGGLRVVLVDAHLRGASSGLPAVLAAAAPPGSGAGRPETPAERAARAVRHHDGTPRRPADDEPDGDRPDGGGSWSVPGLRAVLAGQVPPGEALVAGDDPRLALLPAGAPTAEAGELLAGPAMTRLLVALHRDADVVVVDAPAVLPWADATALTSAAGCEALLVVRQHRTRERDAAAALTELHRSRPASLGLVLLTDPPGRGW